MKYNYTKMAEGIKAFVDRDQDILQYIREPKYRRADVDIEARILHHWDKQGVLLEKNKTGAWFNFSLVEAFWLKIVEKMRDYNLRLELIRNIKNGFLQCVFDLDETDVKTQIKQLILNIDNKEDPQEIDNFLKSLDVNALLNKDQFTLLESIVVQLILSRKNFRLLLNIDGEFFIEDNDNPELNFGDEEYHRFIDKTHLNISLNETMSDLVSDIGVEQSTQRVNILSKEEALVLQLMKNGDIDYLEIKFNDRTKRPEMIEVSKIDTISEAIRLQELILKNGYQNITIKTQNGEIVHCKNTIKYKLDTE